MNSSTTPICPQTPPRRSVRGSILHPTCTPKVTPSKTKTPSSRLLLRTPQTTMRSTVAAPAPPPLFPTLSAGMTTTRGASHLGTPTKRRTPTTATTPHQNQSRYGAQSSPAPPPPTAAAAAAAAAATAAGEDDRFIPSRRHTNLDLCRRALLSGEKRPRSNHTTTSTGAAAAAAAAATTAASADPTGTTTAASSTSPSSGSHNHSSETPLQKEFKRRMLSSLCNIPLTKLDEDGEPTGLLSFRNQNSGSCHHPPTGSTTASTTTAPSIVISSASSSSTADMSSYSTMSSSTSTIHSGGDVWDTTGESQDSVRRGLLSNDATRPVTDMNSMPPPYHPSSYRPPTSSQHHHPRFTAQQHIPTANPFSHDLLRAMKLGENLGLDASAEDLSVAKKVLRKVPATPFRILDAPDIVDDYYLNLISWSKDNILAVALAQSVYLWNASNGEIHHLVTLSNPTDYITSVNWCTMNGHTKWIAVGTNSFAVHLFDAQALQKVRTFLGHSGRVSSLAWNQNWISSGSRDASILHHDVRASTDVVAKYRGHLQEVCGLKWNEEGSCLASGGNENFLCLWDAAMSASSSSNSNNNSTASRGPHHQPQQQQLSDMAPRLILKKHRAAVKALDWCPFHRGLLASGGGTSDRTIKFWSSSSGAMLNSIDTGSQVCSIIWSKHQRELCSSHGYSENQLILWKYPTMTRIKELPGHTARVLNMEMSPDGASVVSAAADETLRFWNVFGNPSSYRKPSSLLAGDIGSFGTPMIR